jgi:hypothetical protein
MGGLAFGLLLASLGWAVFPAGRAALGVRFF